jgi:signal transduction histidine kinase
LENNTEIKILLVDDREDNLFSIETILDTDGYKFTKASSGRKALKILLKEQDFNLILMDVQMPDLNGFETAALIYDREKLRDIPIIFITAHNYSEDNVYTGYKSGGVDYIYKPINKDLLRAKVNVFIELYRKNRQLQEQEQSLRILNNHLEERVKSRTEELIKRNQELKQKNRELKKINNDLDNFVYTASHDLKAPIANLESLISLVTERLEGKFDKEDQQIFSMINLSISKFNKTIKDLTEISKVQKEINDAVEPVSFREITEDIITEINSLWMESGVDITEDYKVTNIIYAKKNIRSILYNLISNALKYRSYDRPLKVHIKTFEEGDFYVYSISDNGLGLTPKQQTKLFSMFKRLHTHVEGSGIGLYIVKRIIENNGGKITVESELNKGTTFTVYIAKSNFDLNQISLNFKSDSPYIISKKI